MQKEAVAALNAVPGSGEMTLAASVGMQAAKSMSIGCVFGRRRCSTPSSRPRKVAKKGRFLRQLGPTSTEWRPQGDSILAGA